MKSIASLRFLNVLVSTYAFLLWFYTIVMEEIYILIEQWMKSIASLRILNVPVIGFSVQ